MRRLFLLAALAGPALPLCAQSPPVVGRGSEVRLRMPMGEGRFARRYDGKVERISGDTLVIRPNEGGASRFFVPNTQTQVLVLLEKRSSVMRGATIGALVGVLSAGFVATLAGQECTGSGVLCFRRRPLALRNAAVIGGAGLAIGATVGALKPRKIWSGAWMGAVEPPATGAAFAAGVTFAF